MSDPYREDEFEQRLRRLEMSVVCITKILMDDPRLAISAGAKGFREAFPKLFQALSELHESVSKKVK